MSLKTVVRSTRTARNAKETMRAQVMLIGYYESDVIKSVEAVERHAKKHGIRVERPSRKYIPVRPETKLWGCCDEEVKRMYLIGDIAKEDFATLFEAIPAETVYLDVRVDKRKRPSR